MTAVRAVSARFHIEYNGFLTNHVTHGLQALGASEADLDLFFTHYASAKLKDSDKEHTPPTTSTRDGGAESAAATNRAEQHAACADVPPCNGDGDDAQDACPVAACMTAVRAVQEENTPCTVLPCQQNTLKMVYRKQGQLAHTTH
jgi:hypothetical protein